MLITPAHKSLYALHYQNKPSKLVPNSHLDQVVRFANEIDAHSIVDYGCGGYASIDGFCSLSVHNYDPAIPAFSALPPTADLVVCLDVLEHVEPDCVDEVISHIRDLAIKGIYLTVSCSPSTKTLPDGSPWHCFVKDYEYWEEKFIDFDVLEYDGKRKQVLGRKVIK